MLTKFSMFECIGGTFRIWLEAIATAICYDSIIFTCIIFCMLCAEADFFSSGEEEREVYGPSSIPAGLSYFIAWTFVPTVVGLFCLMGFFYGMGFISVLLKVEGEGFTQEAQVTAYYLYDEEEPSSEEEKDSDYDSEEEESESITKIKDRAWITYLEDEPEKAGIIAGFETWCLFREVEESTLYNLHRLHLVILKLNELLGEWASVEGNVVNAFSDMETFGNVGASLFTFNFLI